jgi:hypothetical protein
MREPTENAFDSNTTSRSWTERSATVNRATTISPRAVDVRDVHQAVGVEPGMKRHVHEAPENEASDLDSDRLGKSLQRRRLAVPVVEEASRPFRDQVLVFADSCNRLRDLEAGRHDRLGDV